MTALSLGKVAKNLGVNVQLLRKEIERNRLKAHYVGGRIIIFENDLQDYFDTANQKKLQEARKIGKRKEDQVNNEKKSQ